MIYLVGIIIPIFLEPFSNKFLFEIFNPIEIFNYFLDIICKDISSISIFLTIPLVFLLLYLFRLYCAAYVMRFIYRTLSKMQKPSELFNAPPRGETRDAVNIYHTRNFLLRTIKYTFQKSLFPWLATWMFNYVGANKIGKNVVIEGPGYLTTEFLECGDNVYIGQFSVTTSHLVESIYGQLSVRKIKLANNTCIGTHVLIPPGTELGEGGEVVAHSGVLKYQKLKANTYFWGLPIRKISPTRFNKLIQLPKELRNKSKKKKSDINNKIDIVNEE